MRFTIRCYPQRNSCPTPSNRFKRTSCACRPRNRAKLLDRLIASLDADSDAEAAWDELAGKREQELQAGVVEPVPLEVAVARLEARFRG